MRYIRGAVVCVFLTTLGFAAAQEGGTPLSAEEARNVEVVQRAVDELWNRTTPTDPYNVQFELYHLPFEFHAYRDAETGGTLHRKSTPTFLRDLQSSVRVAFPDLRLTVDDIVARGDTVVVRYTAEGTFTYPCIDLVCGVSAGLKATGEEVEWSGVLMYRFEDGKIAEEWRFFDWDWLDFVTRGEAR